MTSTGPFQHKAFYDSVTLRSFEKPESAVRYSLYHKGSHFTESQNILSWKGPIRDHQVQLPTPLKDYLELNNMAKRHPDVP